MLKKVMCTARYDSEKVIIGMFDNDVAGIKAFKLDNNYGFHQEKGWKEHKNKKGFAFLIPVNEETKKIAEGQNLSIEFLFSRETLNKKVNDKGLILKPQCAVTLIKGVQMQIRRAADEYWYMSDIDNDTKTDVLKESQSYREVVRMRNLDDDVTGEQIIVRSLKQPTCSDISISNRSIHYTIEKELGIELVGDVKVKIEANEEEDPWDEIIDENSDDKLDDELTDDFIQENPI